MNISDINSEARALVDADTISYPAADLLRRINASYEKRVAQIIAADGLWQFDDSNYTDFPIGTTTLVASQQDYAFDSSHLEIERVEVKNSDGIWQKLNPIDKSQISIALSEYQKTAGMPMEYDKQGNSILLYPAPASGSVTLASGLKVYFKRTASIFTSAEVTTGTKQPGFASPFHSILSYDAAIPYAVSYKKDRVAALMAEADRLEKEMIKFYSRREQDRRKLLTMAGIDFR